MAYLMDLPKAINKIEYAIEIFNQPATKHKGSPMTGNHEKIKLPAPHFRMWPKARSCLISLKARLGNLVATHQPSTQELIPPKVFPTEATDQSNKWFSSVWVARYINTISDPPGNNVDEIMALTNRPITLNSSIPSKVSYPAHCFIKSYYLRKANNIRDIIK